MTVLQFPPRSREAFLVWEETQPLLYEYVGGEVRPLPERSTVHSVIASNLHAALAKQLEFSKWAVFHAGARIAVGNDVFHPDVSITMGSDAMDGDCIEQPVLVAEVASTTEMYDRGFKRRRFQEMLPSLQTYLLVAEDVLFVEVFRRGESFWQYKACTQPDEVLMIGEPSCQVAMSAIYERVLERLVGRRA